MKEFLRDVKRVLLGYRLCHSTGCGQFFRGPGYAILGRTYCSEACAPALYRKVVEMRKLDRKFFESCERDRDLAMSRHAVDQAERP